MCIPRNPHKTNTHSFKNQNDFHFSGGADADGSSQPRCLLEHFDKSRAKTQTEEEALRTPNNGFPSSAATGCRGASIRTKSSMRRLRNTVAATSIRISRFTRVTIPGDAMREKVCFFPPTTTWGTQVPRWIPLNACQLWFHTPLASLSKITTVVLVILSLCRRFFHHSISSHLSPFTSCHSSFCLPSTFKKLHFPPSVTLTVCYHRAFTTHPPVASKCHRCQLIMTYRAFIFFISGLFLPTAVLLKGIWCRKLDTFSDTFQQHLIESPWLASLPSLPLPSASVQMAGRLRGTAFWWSSWVAEVHPAGSWCPLFAVEPLVPSFFSWHRDQCCPTEGAKTGQGLQLQLPKSTQVRGHDQRRKTID